MGKRVESEATVLFPIPVHLFVFSNQEPLQLMSFFNFYKADPIFWLLLYNSTSDSVPFLEMGLKVLTLIMQISSGY